VAVQATILRGILGRTYVSTSLVVGTSETVKCIHYNKFTHYYRKQIPGKFQSVVMGSRQIIQALLQIIMLFGELHLHQGQTRPVIFRVMLRLPEHFQTHLMKD
jgi:hypothetical protein